MSRFVNEPMSKIMLTISVMQSNMIPGWMTLKRICRKKESPRKGKRSLQVWLT